MADLVHLFISPGHNFVGRYGLPPNAHETVDCKTVECVAGRGLRGDRYFDHRENYKGQVTFFAMEVFEDLQQKLRAPDRSPAVFRRNILTRGLDLNALIERQFLLGGVHFEGVEECRPCSWMEQAFAPGAEALLRGRGGLRARILSDGLLHRTTDVPWEILDAALA